MGQFDPLPHGDLIVFRTFHKQLVGFDAKDRAEAKQNVERGRFVNMLRLDVADVGAGDVRFEGETLLRQMVLFAVIGYILPDDSIVIRVVFHENSPFLTMLAEN